jgi:hypothetical protein
VLLLLVPDPGDSLATFLASVQPGFNTTLSLSLTIGAGRQALAGGGLLCDVTGILADQQHVLVLRMSLPVMFNRRALSPFLVELRAFQRFSDVAAQSQIGK